MAAEPCSDRLRFVGSHRWESIQAIGEPPNPLCLPMIEGGGERLDIQERSVPSTRSTSLT